MFVLTSIEVKDKEPVPVLSIIDGEPVPVASSNPTTEIVRSWPVKSKFGEVFPNTAGSLALIITAPSEPSKLLPALNVPVTWEMVLVRVPFIVKSPVP